MLNSDGKRNEFEKKTLFSLVGCFIIHWIEQQQQKNMHERWEMRIRMNFTNECIYSMQLNLVELLILQKKKLGWIAIAVWICCAILLLFYQF